MLGIIIFGIVLLIAIILIITSGRKKRVDVFISVLPKLAIIGIGSIVLSSLVALSYNVSEVTHKFSNKAVLDSDIDVYSLQDNITTKGQLDSYIFFASGYIESEYYYYYSTKNEDNEISTHKIKSSDATVIEIGKKEKPHIEEYVYEDCGPSSFIKFIAMPGLLQDYKFTKFAYYKIYVPEGSMQENVNIDLK